jgi:hypothetical protein
MGYYNYAGYPGSTTAQDLFNKLKQSPPAFQIGIHRRDYTHGEIVAEIRLPGVIYITVKDGVLTVHDPHHAIKAVALSRESEVQP